MPVAEALKEKLLIISPNAKAETLATIVDPNKFNFTDYQRPKRIITVSGTENHQRLMVKGLDRFMELTELLQDFEFIIIGATEGVKSFFEPLPSNLILLPSQPFDQMKQHYQSASFYAQLSRSEGLPNALCEAMMCGCIPIGTDVGDIRIAIGDTGITLDEWNPEKAIDFIRNNHNNNELRDNARERIITLYDPARRINRLGQLLETATI
jgi:glycosyltransferase involved in cell wall biosynthesis